MLERRTLRSPRVKRIVAISQYVKHQLAWHYKIDDRRVVRVANAAEVGRPDPAQPTGSRAEVRRRWGFSADDTVYLFASMEAHRKGLAQVISAFAHLREKAPQARLVIAGLNDEAPRRELTRLGLSDATRWLGPIREMDGCYAASDVTVLPSWYDPASKVVIESLLHGIPAISTLTNGASEWIYSPDDSAAIPSPFGGAGRGIVRPAQQPAGRVIADAADVPALTQAMLELYDPAERARCAAACAGIERMIGMTAHVEALEEVLTAVAAERRRG
jgi:UDP-glucose:(heptosyl)LPS alpha-1,3-glucosyltransferase